MSVIVKIRDEHGAEQLYEVENGVNLLTAENTTQTFYLTSGNADVSDLQPVDVARRATARISAAERAKIIPENIASGVTILGVTGTHSGGSTDEFISAGDTLGVLYLSDFQEAVNALTQYAREQYIDSQTSFPIMRAVNDNAQIRLELIADITVLDVGVSYEVNFSIQAWQNEVPVLTRRINGLEIIGMIDLSGYALSVSDILSQPLLNLCCTKKPMKFGVDAFATSTLENGSTVTDLFFNTSLDATSVGRLLSVISYDQTGPYGLQYAVLGLGYLCAADLSTVPLLGKSGYVVYWGYDMTPIYSTTAFDASALIPELVVTTPGWQVGEKHLTEPTGNGVVVDASGFLPMFWNLRRTIMSDMRFGSI